MFTMLSLIIAAAAQAAAAPQSSEPPCQVGGYEAPDGELLVLFRAITDQNAFHYLFLDGRGGRVNSPTLRVRCSASGVAASGSDGKWMAWRKQHLRLTPAHFQNDGITFNGLLIEPERRTGKLPLVVMVSGSEHYGAVGTSYPYLFAAQGITTFVYDKRGTGESGGQYTQNFDVLGADAAAAMKEARRLDAGRYSRTGFLGGSQAGWIAPLGAYLAHADFVVVGFGMVVTPLEEDSEQVYDELRRKGYGPAEIAKAREVTKAVDDVMASHFTSGFEELAAVKRKFGAEPWFHQIEGEFTGDLLKTDERTLRTKGRDLFDNLQIEWHYDALGLMQKLNIPQLWVIAGADREAPNGLTLQRLALLQREGKPIQVRIFPHTDHGISEFVEGPDGTRKTTRYADGYLRLEGDWVKGEWRPPYGDSFPMQGTPPSPPAYSHPWHEP